MLIAHFLHLPVIVAPGLPDKAKKRAMPMLGIALDGDYLKLRVDFQQACAVCFADKFCDIARVGLAKQLFAVILHSVGGDENFLSDFFAVIPC